MDAGATDISRISFDLDDPEQANRVARAEAVRNARAKAEELAAAVDATLGSVITISDTTFSPDADQDVESRGSIVAYSSAAPPPIQAGETGVAATVTVTYALE